MLRKKNKRDFFTLKFLLGGNTELVVRQGITSEGVPVENLRSPVSEMQPPSRALREMIIPVEVGFYIALRGTFSARSKLSIVYAAFSYMGNKRIQTQSLLCFLLDKNKL
jgi:hypothetical protein